MRFTAEQKFDMFRFVEYVKEADGRENFEKELSKGLLRKIVDEMADSGKLTLSRQRHFRPDMVEYRINSTILTDTDVYEIKSAIKRVESYLRKHIYENEPAILELHAMWHLITKGDTKPFSFDKSKSYFSFAKFLSENFEYHDNTAEGDEYIRDGEVFTEREVFKEWKCTR